jgi:hypothetical protein
MTAAAASLQSKWLLTIAFVSLLGWLPVLSILVAAAIAAAGHCQGTEAGAGSCMLLGADFGGIVYALGVSGWFFLQTWPLALASIVLWALVGIRRVLRGTKQ